MAYGLNQGVVVQVTKLGVITDMNAIKAIILIAAVLCVSFPSAQTAEDITITVVYNNVPYDAKLDTSWGLSILIEGLEDTILFDTGGDGLMLLSNMEKLGIAPKTIETIVLSHIHMDHIGGLSEFLQKNREVTVYLPASFPLHLKRNIMSATNALIAVDTAQKICAQVWSTGELGTSLREQSLMITTGKGIVIITGCAHPGIVNIVKYAKEYLNQNVYLVMGGFHLMAYTEYQVVAIINELKEMGVRKVAPSHCTGGKPIELFEAAWDGDFIDLGCGAKLRITFNDQ
jgi:7,8-dihydropterin-6-yl-methyl-4-(beta-D-ribofuranosyl)aminobenzene 5'-phosphate synthase